MIGRRPEYGLLGDRLAIQAFGWLALLTISDCPAILRLPVPADRRWAR
jgi:hypothetical protein